MFSFYDTLKMGAEITDRFIARKARPWFFLLVMLGFNPFLSWGITFYKLDIRYTLPNLTIFLHIPTMRPQIELI